MVLLSFKYLFMTYLMFESSREERIMKLSWYGVRGVAGAAMHPSFLRDHRGEYTLGGTLPY